MRSIAAGPGENGDGAGQGIPRQDSYCGRGGVGGLKDIFKSVPGHVEARDRVRGNCQA